MRPSAPCGAPAAGGTPSTTVGTRGGEAAGRAARAEGSCAGCTVGPVDAARPIAEATTLRKDFRSTGLVR